MREKAYRLGFIGGAFCSAVGYAHKAACAMDNRWTLTAGCFSPIESENAETVAAYGIDPARAYTDWRAFLDKEKDALDAVAVITPTPTHPEIVTACLRAGVPVLCEKALATTSAEARTILDARDETNGFLAVTYNYTGYPMVRELRDLIRRGGLGRLIHFQAEMPQEGFIRTDGQGHKPAPQGWRLRDGAIPTIHLDLGVHVHHLLHYLTGEHPEAVVADQRSYGWFDVMDNVTCLCRYTGNIQGQLWYSKSALGHRNGLRLRVYGTEASAEWHQFTPEDVLLSFKDGRRQILDRGATVHVTHQRRYNRFKAGHPAGYIEAFANLYTDIADALAMYKANGTWEHDEVFSADVAAEGLRVLEAIVASAQTNGWAPVERL